MSDDRETLRIAGTGIAQPVLSFPRSFLLALVIEVLLLSAAAVLVAHAKTLGEQDKPIELVFEESTPSPPKEEPKPLPKPVVRPVPRIPVPSVPTPRVVEPPLPIADSPVSEPLKPPLPPPPPTHGDDTAEKEADFAAKLRAAVQAALVYPPAARIMGFHGKARVEFVFKDGVSSQVRIIQSGGSNLIDQAALAAVTNAVAPPLPDSLKGKSKTYQVTVSFELNAAR